MNKVKIQFDRDPQEHSVKLIVAGVVGVITVVVLSCLMSGCGDVTVVTDDAGTAGATGTMPDAGHDVLAMKADGGFAGAGGSAGAAGTAGVGGVGGAAGTPGRPLGAGCTADSQCGSNVCVVTDTGMCCDRRPGDACSPCVGGYVTPLKNGSLCGPGEGPPYSCQDGACKQTP